MNDGLNDYTRRGFFRLGLGLAAGGPLALSSGCTSASLNSAAVQIRNDAKVAIVPCTSYSVSEVQDALSQAFKLLGGIEPLVAYFPRIARALLIGRDAPVLAATLAAHGVPFETVGTLEAAVSAGFAAAKAADAPVVLLSPACASWDQFTGYDQRGDRFADLARGLATGGAH